MRAYIDSDVLIWHGVPAMGSMCMTASWPLRPSRPEELSSPSIRSTTPCRNSSSPRHGNVAHR